jgi:hypothetical protein
MNLTLIISDKCDSCKRAKSVIDKIQSYYPKLSTQVIHINFYKGKGISITPALLIGKDLFGYGDIDEDKLIKKINERAAIISSSSV